MPVNRPQRVLRQDVLDIHQQQFLMLLLVFQPQRDPLQHLVLKVAASLSEQSLHGLIDMAAIGVHLAYRRPRQQPAPRPLEGRAVGLVVGIEQMVVAFIQRAIARQEGKQHEGLEEPGDMRQMPFRRADVRHALNHIVFSFQRLTEPFTGGAYPLVTLP